MNDNGNERMMEGEIDPGRERQRRSSRLEARIEDENAAKGRAARRDIRLEPNTESSIRA